jgi:hypothetical protein
MSKFITAVALVAVFAAPAIAGTTHPTTMTAHSTHVATAHSTHSATVHSTHAATAGHEGGGIAQSTAVSHH